MSSDQEQRQYWEREHGHREYDHPVVRYFARQRIGFLSNWLDLSKVQCALDVGCGNGFSSYYLKDFVPEIWGIDVSHYMLKRNPFIKTKRFIQASGFRLPFADNSFDMVYAWEALHHISNPALIVEEMRRVSRKYILLAEPNRNHPAQFLFALVDHEHRWVLRYNKRYLIKIAETAGVSVRRIESAGWLFPNVTPVWLMPVIKILPYRFPLGISNWLLGVKQDAK